MFHRHVLDTGSGPWILLVTYKVEARVLEYASYSPPQEVERNLDPPE
jgi:hypothetical protein